MVSTIGGCIGLVKFVLNYGENGEAFGSLEANAKGSGSTGSSGSQKLCSVYSPELYQRVKNLLEADATFSNFDPI